MANLCNNLPIGLQQVHGVGKKSNKPTAFRGDRLKWMREAKGLTQVEMGELAKLAMSQISRYENGVSDPDAMQIKKIATALDVTTDYLLGLSDDPETSYHPEKHYSVQEQMLIAKWRAGDLDRLASEILTESLRRKEGHDANDSQSHAKHPSSDTEQQAPIPAVKPSVDR